MMKKIKIWREELKKIIVDENVVKEYLNEFVRKGMIERNMERIMRKG